MTEAKRIPKAKAITEKQTTHLVPPGENVCVLCGEEVRG